MYTSETVHINRLVTGSPDGQLKVWNYNSGECLKILDKGYWISTRYSNTGGTLHYPMWFPYIMNTFHCREHLWSYKCKISLGEPKQVSTYVCMCSETASYQHMHRYIVAVGWDKRVTVFPVGIRRTLFLYNTFPAVKVHFVISNYVSLCTCI